MKRNNDSRPDNEVLTKKKEKKNWKRKEIDKLFRLFFLFSYDEK